MVNRKCAFRICFASKTFPLVGTVVGFVVGALVGLAVSTLFPSYEEKVQQQIPLAEFEENLQAQTPRSMQNQVFAQQEFDLMQLLRQGPDVRGPYNMRDEYDRRNRSTSPGNRYWTEAGTDNLNAPE